MQPTDDIRNELFSNCQERIKEYFYDHVVPTSSVLPMVLPMGPSNKTFQFKYDTRNDANLVSSWHVWLKAISEIRLHFLYSYENWA